MKKIYITILICTAWLLSISMVLKTYERVEKTRIMLNYAEHTKSNCNLNKELIINCKY